MTLSVIAVLLAGCPSNDATLFDPDAGPPPDIGPRPDAGPLRDVGAPFDAGMDAYSIDAYFPDVFVPDAHVVLPDVYFEPIDVFVPMGVDAGELPDVYRVEPDVYVERPDVFLPDVWAPDAGMPDAGMDAGMPQDAGPLPVDAGRVCWEDVQEALVGSRINDAGRPVPTCVDRLCHGNTNLTPSRVANLIFDMAGQDLYQRLLMPSCEYSPFPLVTPGNPDRSWLLVKVEGPSELSPPGMGLRQQYITFTPPPGDPPAGTCSGPLFTPGRQYGVLMPNGARTPDPIAPLIRAWITQGAPGPGMCP